MANIKVAIYTPEEWWNMVTIVTEEPHPEWVREHPDESVLRYELPADLLERYVNAKEELYEVMSLVEQAKKEQDNERNV